MECQWVQAPTRHAHHALEELLLEPVHRPKPNRQTAPELAGMVSETEHWRVCEIWNAVNLRGIKGVQHSCQTRPCMGGDVGNLLGLDRVVSIELPAALAPGGPGLRASPTLTPRHRASQLRVKLTTQTQSTRTCVGSDNFDVTVNTRTLSPAFNASCKWPFKPTIRRPPTSAWGARDHHLPLSV